MKTMAFSSSSKKKAKKNSSISQFFRDRMQSHRQRTGTGSPLVMETGFPASLVDLIVKNRQRMRRSSEGSLIQESPASPPAVWNHVAEQEDDAVQGTVPDVEKCKGFLPAVLMVCVVSVLALWAKKFALGLTMSAFFLIFMESMGKNVFGLLIPCHNWKKQFGLMMAKILRLFGRIREAEIGSKGSDFREKNEIEIIKAEDFLDVASVADAECKGMGIVRSSKIRKSNPLSAFLEEEEEDEEEEEVFELKKKKKWQKAKMKSKLKHIFAKKEKKKKKEANVESRERSSECQSDLRLSEGKDDAVAEICPEEEPTKKKCSNSGCLIVCTIVLIGLSGGRMYALLLILSCCLLKKSGCGMFMIRHFPLDV